MTVVLDSSALITLARIGRLELLHRIAGVIHVPNGVFEEVVQRGAGRPGSIEVKMTGDSYGLPSDAGWRGDR